MKSHIQTFATIAAIGLSVASALFADELDFDMAREEVERLELLAWTKVDSNSYSATINMLLQQTKVNYEQIRTWKGAYDIQQLQVAGHETQRFTCKFGFVIDQQSNSVFRDFDTTSFSINPTAGQPSETERSSKRDRRKGISRRSSVSNGRYIFFSPKAKPATYSYLPDHPAAQKKRAAYRLPANFAENQDKGEMLDPRVFFGSNSLHTSWSELGIISKMIDTAIPAPERALLGEFLTVSRASDGQSEIFRIQVRLSDSKNAGVLKKSSYFSSSAAFNPIAEIQWAQEGDTVHLASTMCWIWTSVDGVALPQILQESVYLSDGGVSYRRFVSGSDFVINHDIDRGQFDYSGLGIENGDLVIDKVQRRVFAFNDGNLEALGEFGERRTEKARDGRSRYWIIGLNVVVMIVIFSYLKYFRSKTHM